MPEKPTTVGSWATTGGTRLEPSPGQKAAGFVINDRPPARWINFLWGLLFDWIDFLDDPVGTGSAAPIDASGGTGSAPGLVGRGGDTNGDGARGFGDGTGAGIDATGGSSSGPGVIGRGGSGGAGDGAQFLGTAGGEGVRATGGASGGFGAVLQGGSGGGKGCVGAGVGSGTTGRGGEFIAGVSADCALQADATSGNTDGVRGNATGSGDGVTGIGGSTNGEGVVGTAGGDGAGGFFTGAGTGRGCLGVGGPTDGAGVRGVGQGNGIGVDAAGAGTGTALQAIAQTGYGVRAESDTTTPARSALQIVPQGPLDPATSPVAGDSYVNAVTGKLAIHEGTLFARYVPFVLAFAGEDGDDEIIFTASPTTFATSYTLPADRVRAESIIRVRVSGRIDTSAGASLTMQIRIGGVTVLQTIATTPTAGNRWVLEFTGVFKDVGVPGTFIANGTTWIGTVNDGAEANRKHGFDIFTKGIDTTGSTLIEFGASGGNSGVARLETATIEVT